VYLPHFLKTILVNWASTTKLRKIIISRVEIIVFLN
jgi:hypothetical protein